MKVEFKVRVVHFMRGRYKVQYSNKKFLGIFRIWNSLLTWFNQMPDSGTECWTLKLFSVQEAEQLAKSLKSIEDVKNWYVPHEFRETQFKIQKEEYYKNQIPYKSKNF